MTAIALRILSYRQAKKSYQINFHDFFSFFSNSIFPCKEKKSAFSEFPKVFFRKSAGSIIPNVEYTMKRIWRIFTDNLGIIFVISL